MVTNATKAKMTSELEALVRATEAQAHDQVVIYYSGHGTTIADQDGDEGPGDANDEALVLLDAPDAASSEDSSLLRDDEFRHFVDRISMGTRQLVVVFDCCFSAGAIKRPDANDSRPRRLSKRIPEADLYRLFSASGTSVRGLRAKGPPRAKGDASQFLKKGGLSEIQWGRAAGSLVFLSATSELEEAAAGESSEELSAFTKAFLGVVEPDGGANTSLTLEQIHAELVRRLHGVQTPVLRVEGAPKETQFAPDVFPSPRLIRQQRALARILEELVFLKAPLGGSTWKIESRNDSLSRVAIGDRYELRVKPSHDGHLVVFTVQAGKEVTFFYPNKYQRNTTVSGGKELLIPWEGGLRADPPAGEERFFIYLLEHDPFRHFDFDQCVGPLPVGRIDNVVRRCPRITNDTELVRMLSTPFNGGQESAAAQKPQHWARAEVTVLTVPR